MNTGKLADAILVAPDLSPRHIDSECVDGADIDMETWMTKLVPQFITENLRASGGVGVGRVRLQRWCLVFGGRDGRPPRSIWSGIILGGYFKPLFTNWWPFLLGRMPSRYDLLGQLEHARPATSVWIEVSQKDRLSGGPSAAFVRRAQAPTAVTSVVLPHAGHRMEVWGAITPQSLGWLAHPLPAFAPVPLRGR